MKRGENEKMKTTENIEGRGEHAEPVTEENGKCHGMKNVIGCDFVVWSFYCLLLPWCDG